MLENFIIMIIEFILIFPSVGICFLFRKDRAIRFSDYFKKQDHFTHSSISVLVLATVFGIIYSLNQ
jgi:hypothetical protein